MYRFPYIEMYISGFVKWYRIKPRKQKRKSPRQDPFLSNNFSLIVA